MTQSEYEQKRRECWEEFTTMSLHKAFNFAFDRAYALGKQEMNSEAEEMLMVPRKKVQEMYADIINDIRDYNGENLEMVGTTDPILRERAAGMKAQLRRLFGSKCLPDDTKNDTKEPKFKLGDKVKDISSPHDDGIYKVDDIKKSSDGFIYHIQGLIGKSNVKESDLEPYTEPEEEPSPNVNHSDINIDELVAKCCVPDPAKQFDNILKNGFSKERRLNIAMRMMQALVCAPPIPGVDPNPPAKNLAKTAFRLADALISKVEKGTEL